MTENVFTTGIYHQNFDSDLTRSTGGYDSFHHRQWLTEGYTYAFNIIEKQGWRNPLSNDSPRVLLMGTASHHTARTFVDFVKRRNANTQIAIADISSHPLARCAENGLDQESNVTLHQADIRNLLETFPPNSFDLIETDGLFQFLSPEDKKQALEQVFAALKPGGIFTTRDRFVPETADRETEKEYQRWQRSLEDRLEADVYPSTKESMWRILGETGFSRTMVRRDNYRSLRFLNHIVAKKPEAK